MSLDISIAPFVKRGEIMDQREVWPSQGMVFEVEGCTSPHLTTYIKYAAHWRLQDMQFVKITLCPVEGCKTKFAERWKVNKHLKMEHKFSSEKVKTTILKVPRSTTCTL